MDMQLALAAARSRLLEAGLEQTLVSGNIVVTVGHRHGLLLDAQAGDLDHGLQVSPACGQGLCDGFGHGLPKQAHGGGLR